MAYTEKNVFGEIVLINLIRLAFAAVCVCFAFPMFKTTVTYFGIDVLQSEQTLTGFNTIFGIVGSSAAGHPFALVMFVFPIIAIMVTLTDFLYNYLHIAILITGIAGAILSVVFYIATLVKLNGKEQFFNFTLYEVRTGLSWGCLLILGLYVAIIVFSFLYGKVAKED